MRKFCVSQERCNWEEKLQHVVCCIMAMRLWGGVLDLEVWTKRQRSAISLPAFLEGVTCGSKGCLLELWAGIQQ